VLEIIVVLVLVMELLLFYILADIAYSEDIPTADFVKGMAVTNIQTALWCLVVYVIASLLTENALVGVMIMLIVLILRLLALRYNCFR